MSKKKKRREKKKMRDVSGREVKEVGLCGMSFIFQFENPLGIDMGSYFSLFPFQLK
jgi:hypothetical protein